MSMVEAYISEPDSGAPKPAKRLAKRQPRERIFAARCSLSPRRSVHFPESENRFVFVDTDEMSNRFEVGEEIIVSENGPVQPDDDVLLEMKRSYGGTKWLLARLVSDSGEHLRLQTFNPRRWFNMPKAAILRVRHVLTMNDIGGVPGPSSFLRK